MTPKLGVISNFCCFEFMLDFMQRRQTSPIRTLPYVILFALVIMVVPLWGDCIVAYFFVVNSHWIINEPSVLWNQQKCKHSKFQQFPVKGFCRILLEDICIHSYVTFPRSATEYHIVAPTNCLRLVKRLSDDLDLKKLNNDEINRISTCLLTLGANLLLRDEPERDVYMATSIAMFISLFEELYQSENGEMAAKDILSMSRGLAELGKRGIIKFYTKRIKCSCLETKYRSVEREAKHGMCSCCRQMKKPTELFLCTRCWSRQYCSKDCQRRDWKDGGHESYCRAMSHYVSPTSPYHIKATFSSE